MNNLNENIFVWHLGDVVVVSGAAGAVGSMVGQIAKIKGCKVRILIFILSKNDSLRNCKLKGSHKKKLSLNGSAIIRKSPTPTTNSSKA